MHNDISEIYFSEQDLADRVREMGEAITRDYAGAAGSDGIVVISILRGGAVFTLALKPRCRCARSAWCRARWAREQ